MKQWVYFISLIISFSVSYSQTDRFWNGESPDWDDISQPSNWLYDVNPNPDDNLYFNNTTGSRHSPYCNYGSGAAKFGYIIVYNGAGGIKWRGGYETSAYKFENYNDPNTFEIECYIANRTDNNVEINPVLGPIDILAACQVTIQSGQYLDIWGSNTLSVNGIITGAGNIALQSAASPTVIFNNANTYTGHTYVNGGTLHINYANTISTTNNITIDGGTLQISADQTINNLTLSSGTLIIDAGKTLTINGTYSSTGGSISNNGTIVFNSNNSFPGAATTLSTCYNLTGNASITLNKSITITNNLTLNSGTFALNNNLLILDGASLTNGGGVMSGSTTSDLTVQGAIGGTVVIPITSNISLRTLTIDGNRVLEMNGTNNIRLYGVMTIYSSATYDNGGESQIIIGGGVPAINIYGKFITRDADGFTGGSTAIPGIAPTLISGCTIEYGRAGDQLISIRIDYQNLIFSNGGTKTHAVASPITPITGTVTINDNTIVDVSNNTFGSGGTNLIMNSTSKFITAGIGVKPDMTGTYTLGINTTIEFINSLGTLQRIRLTPTSGVVNYANILVNGSNVGTETTANGIAIQSSGSFTINAGAKFIFLDPQGFSGGTGTAINNTASEITVTLASGSTIEYNGSGQTITNQYIYKNLTNNSGGTNTLAGNITVDENLNLTAGTLDASANTITLFGNITGTATQTNSSGKILMTGASKSISGATIGNLVLDNTFGFSLSGSPTINGTLTFTNGKLSLGAFNITMIKTSAPFVGASTSNFILTNSTGVIKQTIASGATGTYLFPVGATIGMTDYYNPATITWSSLVAVINQLSARFIASPLSIPEGLESDAFGYLDTETDDLPTPITEFLNNGYWEINNTGAGTPNNYQIDLTASGASNVAYYAQQHTIFKNSGIDPTGWTQAGTAFDLWGDADIGTSGYQYTTTPDPLHLQNTNVFGFSNFGIGRSASYILPIVLTEFNADLINTDVLLNWITASEVNNDYFSIERSMDGSIWNAIGQVNGAGSSSTIHHYDFTDKDAPGMVLYYRLKQIDFNGNYEYSPIRVVNNLSNEQYIIYGYYTLTGQHIASLENAPTGIYLQLSNKGNTKILHTAVE